MITTATPGGIQKFTTTIKKSWFYEENRDTVSLLPVKRHVCKDLRPVSSWHLLLTYVTTAINYICCWKYSRFLHGSFTQRVGKDIINIKNCYKLLRAEVKLLFYNPVFLRILARHDLSGWWISSFTPNEIQDSLLLNGVISVHINSSSSIRTNLPNLIWIYKASAVKKEEETVR
jgi:hypothetical protein